MIKPWLSDLNNTDALINKGNALGSIGNFTEAIKYYDKALAIDLNNTDALDNKVLTQSNMGIKNMSLE